MTKRRIIVAITFIVVCGAALLLKDSKAPEVSLVTLSPSKRTPASVKPTIDPVTKALVVDGRKVVGRSPNEDDQQEPLQIVNQVTKEWEPSLEKALKAQAGSTLKDLTITKVESLIWEQDGMALYVESVVVSITNQKNQQTQFRVLVDAQTGKILKNWDQPVFDPANPRENYQVKIDPSYHQE